MRIETERMKEREATAELIRRLVRDNALRGEFMILFDETDDENFVVRQAKLNSNLRNERSSR